MSAGSIVVVTTSFPILGDGSEAAGGFVLDTAEALAEHVNVRVVAPGPESVCEHWSEGIEIFRFAAPSKPLSTLKPWLPGDLLATAQVLRSGGNALRNAVRSGPTALILALWALPSGYWANRVSREEGIPYSVWTLGSDIWTLGRIPVVKGFLRRALAQAQTCYADGLHLAAETREIGGREVEFLPSTRRIGRVREVPLKHEPPYRLLFLGRWHPNKGVDLLLKALGCLDGQDWSRIANVEICGGGPLECDVRRAVDILRAAGRPVVLHGYLDKHAAEEALLRADYLLLPSRIESIPVVFSDALKLGCPVLATPVGDLPDLLGRTHPAGMLADTVSATAYARMLSAALGRSPASFAEGIEEVRKQFDMDVVVMRLLAGASV
jgi:glycosyltransferase involved in cell wall biosynthesis